MQEAFTPVTLGENNRKILLDFVRKNGPVSRADLHRNLNMSAPTVSTNVRKLIDTGFLLEAGEADNTVGRKATLVMFNEKRAYVAGVDIGRSQLRISIADLLGREVASMKAKSDLMGLNEQLRGMIESALREGGVERERLCCIALGIPGIQDPKTGNAVLAPFAEKMDLSALVKMLETTYPAKILVEKSVNYAAIGEKWQGVAQGYRNILYLSYGIGIGASLILNENLFCGNCGAAGEIGYMISGNGSLRNKFDDCGALEQEISGGALEQYLRRHGHEGTVVDILQGRADDAFSRELLERIVCTLGVVMVNMTAMFNPEAIVVGGGFGDLLADRFRETWLDMLRSHVPFVPEILSSHLHAHANVLGAVAAAIRYANDSCFDTKTE